MRLLRLSVVVVLIAVPLVYLALLSCLVIFQRDLMYFPSSQRGTAREAGLADTETISIKTADNETIVGWYKPAKTKQLFIFFHGNGGNLASNAEILRQLSADGSGYLAIDYRGYGGSTGSPSERGLLDDGDAAYATAKALGYASDQIVLVGESLGTGVAIAVATKYPIKALILDSPFSSAVDMAAAKYWMFPVRLLMKDPFDSLGRIGHVTAPTLFLHATGDPIIAFRFNRKLFESAHMPKASIEVPEACHMVLWKPDVMARVKSWLAGLPSV